MRSRLLRVGLIAAVGVVAVACGGDPGGEAAERPHVIATTTILGDIVATVADGTGTIEILMEAGQDPHDFALSARQAALIRDGDLVVANGLDLEESLLDSLAAAEEEGTTVLRVAEHLDPLVIGDGDDGGGDGHGHDAHGHDAHDPHVWLDPVRMADGARTIADALAQVDAAGARSTEEWRARGATYAREILAAHTDVEDILDTVPGPCRRLVTDHDSLRYFAERYGFEIVGTVIPGTSSMADPSARDFARTARVIADAGVPAIFAETGGSPRLAEALAAEAGGDVRVVALFAGALGPPGSGADTYLGMLRTNAQRIADALRDCPAA